MKDKNILWIFGIIILVFVIIGAIAFFKINKNLTPEKNLSYAENTSCNIDSDCIIKTNGLNCPKAFNKIEFNSEYKQLMPPSHTACPEAEEILTFCNTDCIIAYNHTKCCDIKYDCSKCPTLKKEFGESCSGPKEEWGQIGWICKMYNDCNCS